MSWSVTNIVIWQSSASLNHDLFWNIKTHYLSKIVSLSYVWYMFFGIVVFPFLSINNLVRISPFESRWGSSLVGTCVLWNRMCKTIVKNNNFQHLHQFQTQKKLQKDMWKLHTCSASTRWFFFQTINATFWSKIGGGDTTSGLVRTGLCDAGPFYYMYIDSRDTTPSFNLKTIKIDYIPI